MVELRFKDCPEGWARDLTTGRVYFGREARGGGINLIDDVGDLVHLDDDRLIYFEEVE